MNIKQINILMCLSILLTVCFPFGTVPENAAAESSSVHEDWTYPHLENFVLKKMTARSDWAELPANNSSRKGFYHAERKPVQFIGIHHDGSKNATLKSILKYHVKTKGWGDIAYHFIIDKKGRIYEGRSIDRASDTNNVFKSYGEERLSGIINILLLGNYDVEKIETDSPQIQSAKLLVSFLYLKYPRVALDSIRGHKDFITDSDYTKNLITCPGKNMYTPINMIDEIKNFVSAVSDSNKLKTD
jgi:hypothetical protein